MRFQRALVLGALALACGGTGSGAATATDSAATSDATSNASTAAASGTQTASGSGTTATTTGTTETATTVASETNAESSETGRPPLGPIDTLTVTLSTYVDDEAIVNATPLELCLTATDCFALPRPHRADAGKREFGPLEFDVHAFESVGLTPEQVDRFELRPGVAGEFVPRCLSVAFDGAPALCTKAFPEALGTGITLAPEAASDCVSCFERDADVDLRLTHGPFVGDRDAATGEARVWVRTDASRTVELFVSASPTMADSRLAATVVPQAEDDFTANLVVDQLAAGSRYYYRIVVDGVPHATLGDDVWHPGGIYSLQMPPTPGQPGAFSFALSSCARMFAHGNYDAVRDANPAFLLNVGDYHYGDVLQVHFQNDGGSQDERAARDELRWWYRTAHWERSTLLATVPILNTWDDHDYGGGETYADREAQGRDSSRKTFLEYFANRVRREAATDEALYYRFSYGDVEVFVLDARLHRPRLCDVDGALVACDPQEDPLGSTQTDWLVDRLAASTATFKLIAAGTRFYGGGPKAWTPFLIARDAMLARIVDAGVTGVVFMAGGPHVSEYRQFAAAGRTWHELGSSPISSGLGECSGAEGQVECYATIKNSLLIDVDTTIADPTLVARVTTFDGEKPWSASTAQVVIRRSMLQ